MYFYDNYSYETQPRGCFGEGVGFWVIRVDSSQTGKIEKTLFEVLIFYMKKSRNNPCGYRLYML
jgi:hypothetical protein